MINAFVNYYCVQIKLLKLNGSPQYLRLRLLDGYPQTLHVYDDGAEKYPCHENLFVARRGKQWKVRDTSCIEYVIWDPQPPQDVIRDTEKWIAWVIQQLTEQSK